MYNICAWWSLLSWQFFGYQIVHKLMNARFKKMTVSVQPLCWRQKQNCSTNFHLLKFLPKQIQFRINKFIKNSNLYSLEYIRVLIRLLFFPSLNEWEWIKKCRHTFHRFSTRYMKPYFTHVIPLPFNTRDLKLSRIKTRVYSNKKN